MCSASAALMATTSTVSANLPLAQWPALETTVRPAVVSARSAYTTVTRIEARPPPTTSDATRTIGTIELWKTFSLTATT